MKAVKYIPGSSNIERNNTIIASKVYLANNFFKKTFGLLVFKPLKESEGLLINDCKSIHTIGMKYNIDAVFMDNSGRVVKILSNFAPFRFSPFIREAKSVLELMAGIINKKSISIGDSIDFIE